MMPAIFYTAYEFSSLSETEEVMKNIYEQQMNNILLDINQTSWNTTSEWAGEFRNYLSTNKTIESDSILKIINSKNGIDCIFITDSTLTNFQFFSDNDTVKRNIVNNEKFLKLLKQKQIDINRMIYRKTVGYDKPVTVESTNNSFRSLIILYTYKNMIEEIGIFGICIHSTRFMESLPIVLDDYPQDEIEIGIFDANSENVIAQVGEITFDNAAVVKKIWLFPNYLIGVKMKGVDLNEQVEKRFYSRLKWTIFFNIFLVITIFIIMKNIKSEMNFARIKSDFVSNVSHELRTPLALIRMYSETLSMNRVKSEEKKHKYYNVITKESERLSHLVNNILDFSKMESGKKSFNFSKIELNQIVSDVMEMYVFHLKQKGFQYAISLHKNDLFIKGEAQGITESIINLLDNAMKYSPNKKEITIETGESEKHFWIEVSDKGEGIANTEHTQIFDKFYRVSSGLVHNTKGSGLGLALVDYTMKSHGGKISLKSKLGKGSNFRLNFPKYVEKS